MSEVRRYMREMLLKRSIESHKRIINDGDSVDLTSIGFEKGMSFERVKASNAYTILTMLGFPIEATETEGYATKKLDELAKGELTSEEIIDSLIKYRDENTNH